MKSLIAKLEDDRTSRADAILAVEQMRDKINKPYDLGNKKVTSKEYAEGYNKAIDDVLNLIGKREKND